VPVDSQTWIGLAGGLLKPAVVLVTFLAAESRWIDSKMQAKLAQGLNELRLENSSQIVGHQCLK
jgi:hypothetical protein